MKQPVSLTKVRAALIGRKDLDKGREERTKGEPRKRRLSDLRTSRGRPGGPPPRREQKGKEGRLLTTLRRVSPTKGAKAKKKIVHEVD